MTKARMIQMNLKKQVTCRPYGTFFDTNDHVCKHVVAHAAGLEILN